MKRVAGDLIDASGGAGETRSASRRDASDRDGERVGRVLATGPGAPCGWCRRPIPAGKRKDSKHCHKRCRQAHWKFASQRGAVPPAAETALSLAYADPPYPGKAYLYRGHPDYAGEVDHRKLLVDPAGVSDALEYVARPRLSDPDRVIGAKPAAFCYWLFRLLGARRGDELHDLFPGSGGVSRAWAHFVSPGT